MNKKAAVFSIAPERLQVLVVRPDWQSSPDLETVASLRQKGAIENIVGSISEISFGRPKMVQLNTEALGTSIQLLRYRPDLSLYLLYLTCSFRPAADTDFIRSQLKIKVVSREHTVECLALDLFPRDVYMEARYERAFSLSPSLKFSFEKAASAKVKVGQGSVSEAYLHYDPEIVAFGIGEAVFGWDFNRSKSRAIRGVRDLYAVVEAPPGPLGLKYALDAQI